MNPVESAISGTLAVVLRAVSGSSLFEALSNNGSEILLVIGGVIREQAARPDAIAVER